MYNVFMFLVTNFATFFEKKLIFLLKMPQNHCLLLPEPKKTCVALYGQTTYSH